MKIFYYKTIDEKKLDSNFENEVTRILSDSRGWVKYGYKFIKFTNDLIIKNNISIIKIYLDNNAIGKCGAISYRYQYSKHFNSSR